MKIDVSDWNVDKWAECLIPSEAFRTAIVKRVAKEILEAFFETAAVVVIVKDGIKICSINGSDYKDFIIPWANTFLFDGPSAVRKMLEACKIECEDQGSPFPPVGDEWPDC
jgi:hypothetical protein